MKPWLAQESLAVPGGSSPSEVEISGAEDIFRGRANLYPRVKKFRGAAERAEPAFLLDTWDIVSVLGLFLPLDRILQKRMSFLLV